MLTFRLPPGVLDMFHCMAPYACAWQTQGIPVHRATAPNDDVREKHGAWLTGSSTKPIHGLLSFAPRQQTCCFRAMGDPRHLAEKTP